MSDERVVELYVGIATGGDFGYWRTTYQNVPADLCDDRAIETAIEQEWEKARDNTIFVGLYHLPEVETEHDHASDGV